MKKLVILSFFISFITFAQTSLTHVSNPEQENYAVGVTVLPTFTWSQGSGNGGPYELEVSLEPDCDPHITISNASSIVGTSFTVPDFEPLDPGTLYYWRVKDDLGNPSTTWEFTTVNSEVVISTYYPSGTSASIAWYLTPPASNVRYDLYYSTDATFDGTDPHIDGITGTYKILTDLAPSQQYYVMVRARNSAGTIIYSYSDPVNFTTDGLPQPTCSYPVDDAETYSNPPYLYWYTGAYDNSVEYEVMYWISTGGMPGNIGDADNATNGWFETNSYQLYTKLTATLTAGSTYNWRVRTVKNGSTSDWSETETFKIYSSTPTEAPVCYPSFPIGGDDCYLNPPTFYWYTGTYTTGLYFYVEWDTDNNTGNGYEENSGWIDDLYFSLPDALDAGTYHWRVRSALTSGGGSPGAWSDVESFVIPASTSPVAVPYPTSPVGVTVTTLDPTFTWYAATPPALTYKVRISPYSDTDDDGMLDHTTATQLTTAVGTKSWTFDSDDLVNTSFALVGGATYYWQVIAYDASLNPSSWSYVASFNTAAGSLAIVPFTVSPINEQPIGSTSALLSWDLPMESFTHLTYDVEYSKTKEFNNTIKISNVNETSVKVDGLDANSKYYWRVSSKNYEGNVSNLSNIGSFKTSTATDVNSDNILPEQFSLEQNYPNPFNPTTTISYSLPQNSFVTLKIYDMLGREVKTLVNQNVNAGNIRVDWNGDDNYGNKVASGAYVYRITAGNFVSTKKMLLLK